MTLDRQTYDYRSEYRRGVAQNRTARDIIGRIPRSPFDGKLLLWLKASGSFYNIEKMTTLCCGEMIYLSTVLTRIRQYYSVMVLPIR